ncbi:hypothetical protein BDZ91DRAFT_716175 [Kalaharituber pfeilii]|nr:hypothetical protein BDZ91DRAFT_716175 [Kalaharituber pfeilii]
MTIWSAIDYWACAKAVSAIYDVGSTCHQIWLFMTLFFMRVKGLVHEDDEQFMEFTNMMAKSFGGIDVRELWRDQTYVSEWLRTETARLEKVYESI